MATVTGSKTYTVVAGGVATVTGTKTYTVTTPTNVVNGQSTYNVVAQKAARAYKRTGNVLAPVRMGIRRGSVIDWLTAAPGAIISTLKRITSIGAITTVADPDTSGELNEASGLAISRKNTAGGRVFYSHNDNGGLPIVYAFDEKSPYTLIGKYTLGGATNNDWEDIAVGPGPTAGQSYIYVADSGSLNTGTREIYRFVEPTITVNQTLVTTTIPAGSIDVFTYTSPFTDAEAIFVDPVSGDLYLFQKGNSATRPLMTGVARCPKSQLVAGGGPITFTTFATIPTNINSVNQGGITAADISLTGKYFAICNYEEVWVWNRDADAGDTVASVLSSQPTAPVYKHFPSGWGGESIAFGAADEPTFLYTISEGAAASLKYATVTY